MNPLTYEDVAETVLSEVRAIYPTGRKPDPAITEAWARIFARSHLQVPATVWREAVTTWAVSHGDPPTPHDLVTAAKQVIAQWEAHPEHKQALAEHRQAVLEAKFGAGYGAQHSNAICGPEAPDPSPGEGKRSFDRLRAELARKRHEREALATLDAATIIDHDPDDGTATDPTENATGNEESNP
ncbi:hypothetical protein [Corynebacterium sp. AOP34-BR1-29]|uniref:hypothetical protein n=1 Tax=Corynebacterium sp. AOP34-BR1-29 TaxID=3457688 RepID=UPI00403399C6